MESLVTTNNNEIIKDVKEIITSLSKSFDDELFSKSQDEIEEYWHFEFDNMNTAVNNLYNFHKMLSLYSSFCRRWEEHHNGNCCVVERVRDKYLAPKIKIFVEDFLANYEDK